MKQPLIDFDDMLHGVDVLEDYIRDGNPEFIVGVLNKIRDDIGELTGSAAEHLNSILYRCIHFGDPVDVLSLKTAINALARDYALAIPMETQKTRQRATDENKKRAQEKAQELRRDAAERWNKKPEYSTHAVAKYLIETGKTTLKIRRVSEIIKDLKPNK